MAVLFLFAADKGVLNMDMPKVKLPSASYLVNLTIGLLIVLALLRFMPIPDRFKAWFRV